MKDKLCTRAEYVPNKQSRTTIKQRSFTFWLSSMLTALYCKSSVLRLIIRGLRVEQISFYDEWKYPEARNNYIRRSFKTAGTLSNVITMMKSINQPSNQSKRR